MKEYAVKNIESTLNITNVLSDHYRCTFNFCSVVLAKNQFGTVMDKERERNNYSIVFFNECLLKEEVNRRYNLVYL